MNSSPKILIIDDDPSIHKLLKAALGGHYQVECLQNPTEYWDLLKHIKPDLVLLDLMMPKLSGIDICKKMKSDPEMKKILVLILSAKESQEDRIRGLEIGADDYITKPFHLSSLTRKIDYLLNQDTTILPQQ